MVTATRPDLFQALILFPSDAFDNCPPLLLRLLVQLDKVPRAIPGIAKLIRYRVVQAIVMKLVSKRGHSAETLNDLVGELPRNKGVQRDLSKLIAGLRSEVTAAVVPALASYQAPVLILWSRRDPLFPAAHAHRLAGIFPRAQVHFVDDSRAFISLDQPTSAAEHILGFTRRTLGQS